MVVLVAKHNELMVSGFQTKAGGRKLAPVRLCRGSVAPSPL